ncbi:conserved hypothetical protein [Ixodes scapularis]|uniref:Calcium channel flower n=1 Tax=Ixodes scapularis TaxID=6945 RepID=B7QK59_IXOSC|nr:conserved hypothetical protein [Ixodes scapularis]|eukprot:XP_002415566.1 conserved hypothetical protein [Ixodes scapularis]
MFPNVGQATEDKTAGGRPGDDAPWWLKYLGRFVGTVSALVAIGLGAQLAVLSVVTFSSACLLAAILQMIVGLGVALVEAPCFCAFLEFAQAPGNFFDRKPYWYKALLYGGHYGAVFSVVLLNGHMFTEQAKNKAADDFDNDRCLRSRRASAEEMRARATSTANLVPSGRDVEAASGDMKFSPS